MHVATARWTAALWVAAVACGTRRAGTADAAAATAVDAGAAPCSGKPADCTACNGGEAAACGRVAIETPADRDKVPWYQRGCDIGDVGSCEGLSWAATFVMNDHALFVRATEREHQLRVERHARAVARCDAGDEAACLEVAIELTVGRAVPKDLAAAVALLDAACGRGALDACRELAHLDELSPADRVRHGKRACAAGEQRVCGDLAGLFNDAPLAPGEGAFARATLARLCAGADGTACWVLSGLWWMGKGGPRDRGRAGTLIARACALDPAFCGTLERWKRRQAFFEDLGPLPTLDTRGLTNPGR